MTHQNTTHTWLQRAGEPDCVLLLEVTVSPCPGLRVSVPARLRYHRADPFAVHLDCHADLEEPITWLFARDLLAEGMDGWAGVGDVTIRRSSADPELLAIALSTPGQTAVLHTPAAPVREFLRSSHLVVPVGMEHHYLDTDTLLRRLLDDSRARRDRNE
ncbi:SsgA family sporulation/cell division regulator [Streptomyces sp. TLI_171]|uniref:SsgA family sporulation/cell division regulator n=1 Tax=Streptomyces sp. TLI_171 TaxID=1938859 RepID=UPI000C189D65|nr:SsgA family sporulation/cell division regulator [Streptomyces sp. TLI_171]RKE22212.1 sporulation and cell division protein SsgA [Streptomyces sp. TLI_171]